MKYQFKTNIKCGGCIAKVTPFLDGESGIQSWNVDLESDDRVLSVESESLSEKEVVAVVIAAGYEAAPMKSGLFSKLFSR